MLLLNLRLILAIRVCGVLNLGLVEHKRLMLQLACLLAGRIHAVDLPIELQLLEMVLGVLRFKLRLHADRALHREWTISYTVVVDHRRWYHSGVHGLHL